MQRVILDSLAVCGRRVVAPLAHSQILLSRCVVGTSVAVYLAYARFSAHCMGLLIESFCYPQVRCPTNGAFHLGLLGFSRTRDCPTVLVPSPAVPPLACFEAIGAGEPKATRREAPPTTVKMLTISPKLPRRAPQTPRPLRVRNEIEQFSGCTQRRDNERSKSAVGPRERADPARERGQISVKMRGSVVSVRRKWLGVSGFLS